MKFVACGEKMMPAMREITRGEEEKRGRSEYWVFWVGK